MTNQEIAELTGLLPDQVAAVRHYLEGPPPAAGRVLSHPAAENVALQLVGEARSAAEALRPPAPDPAQRPWPNCCAFHGQHAQDLAVMALPCADYDNTDNLWQSRGARFQPALAARIQALCDQLASVLTAAPADGAPADEVPATAAAFLDRWVTAQVVQAPRKVAAYYVAQAVALVPQAAEVLGFLIAGFRVLVGLPPAVQGGLLRPTDWLVADVLLTLSPEERRQFLSTLPRPPAAPWLDRLAEASDVDAIYGLLNEARTAVPGPEHILGVKADGTPGSGGPG